MRGSLHIAGRSLRENLLPMVVLQGMAAVCVAAYLWVPGVAEGLEPLRTWHRLHYGFGTCLNRFAFCWLVPGFVLWILPSLRPRNCLLTLTAGLLWSIALGMVCEYFTQFQAWIFGDSPALGTLFAKILVDQLGFSALVTVPLNAVFFFWLAEDFSFVRFRRDWPKDAFSRVYLPNLFCNWVVWAPVNFLVYVFPQAPQIQVGGFVGAFYILLCLRLGKNGRIDSGS